MKGRRSCAISLGNTCSLRRPGTFGLIAGWGPAASDLTARYKDVGTGLYGRSIVDLFRLSASVSRGAAITAIRDGPPGVIGSNRRSFRRSPPRRGTIVQPLTGLRKVSTTSGQRILARIKLLVLRRGQRNSLPDWTLAHRIRSTGWASPLSD